MADSTAVDLGDRQEVLPALALDIGVFSHRRHVDRPAFGFGFVLGRADLHAHRTTRAVIWRDLDREVVIIELARPERLGRETARRIGDGGRFEGFHPDHRVRADHRALTAVDAQIRFPDRNEVCKTALLPHRGARREGAIGQECRYGQQIAVAGEHRCGDPLDELGCTVGDDPGALITSTDLGGDLDAVQRREGQIDRGEIAFDHRGTESCIGPFDRDLDGVDGRVGLDDIDQRKETRLHDRVDPAGHVQFAGQRGGIDAVHREVLVDDVSTHLDGQMVPQFLGAVRSVQQQGAPGARHGGDIELLEEVELMTGHQIGLLNQIGGADRIRPEPQMRDRGRSGLLGVIDEISLGIETGHLTEDLHRCLVGADRAIATEREEHRLSGALPIGTRTIGGVGLIVKARARDIVDDADGESSAGLICLEFGQDPPGHRRGELFGTEAVPAPDHPRHHRGIR